MCYVFIVDVVLKAASVDLHGRLLALKAGVAPPPPPKPTPRTTRAAEGKEGKEGKPSGNLHISKAALDAAAQVRHCRPLRSCLRRSKCCFPFFPCWVIY